MKNQHIYEVRDGVFVRQNIGCKPVQSAKLTVYAIKGKPENVSRAL